MASLFTVQKEGGEEEGGGDEKKRREEAREENDKVESGSHHNTISSGSRCNTPHDTIDHENAHNKDGNHHDYLAVELSPINDVSAARTRGHNDNADQEGQATSEDTKKRTTKTLDPRMTTVTTNNGSNGTDVPTVAAVASSSAAAMAVAACEFCIDLPGRRATATAEAAAKLKAGDSKGVADDEQQQKGKKDEQHRISLLLRERQYEELLAYCRALEGRLGLLGREGVEQQQQRQAQNESHFNNGK